MSDNALSFSCKSFAALSPHELYAVMRLRNEVFVVEQHCVYQDADNKDPYCHHLLLWKGDLLVAYARLLPKNISYPEMSIGRIVSAPSHRNTGAGKLLVKTAIEKCRELFGAGPVHIGAQLYLKRFYESFGFVPSSGMYLEDGIEHIEMVLEQAVL